MTPPLGNGAGPYSLENLVLARTDLIVLQASTLCNMDCQYCCLPDRKKNQAMSLETLRLIIQNLIVDEIIQPKTKICWHLGEPTLAGIDFYKEAHETIRALTFGKFGGIQMQTNGLLLNKDWCNLAPRRTEWVRSRLLSGRSAA